MESAAISGRRTSPNVGSNPAAIGKAIALAPIAPSQFALSFQRALADA